MRRAARRGLDLLLPPRPLDEGTSRGTPVQSQGLAGGAWSAITFVEAPVCDGCGAPFDFAVGPAALCPACHVRRPAFDRARAACVYDEHSRDLILKLKHADRTDLAGLFARWLARAAGDLLADADLIVPVPLHRWRLLGRRYNQAAEIARPLARLAGVPYAPGVLVRPRATASQGGKSGAGRRRNVAAAFATPAGAKGRLAGARVVLVDDVLTTGATAEGCARALRAAGAAAVDLAVVARVKQLTPRPI